MPANLKIHKVMSRNIPYLAGLIDADGCFNVTKNRTAFSPRLIIVNTNKDVMDWLVYYFDGDITKTFVKNKPYWKPRYSWRLTHKKALLLAEEVEPYLIIKREQALIFITWRVISNIYKPLERKPWYLILKGHINKLNQKGVKLNAKST